MSETPRLQIGAIGWTDLTVEDVDASAALCVEMGGKIVSGPKAMGEMGRYCVIRDPAGAVAALFAYP